MKIQLKARQQELLKILISSGVPLDIEALVQRFNKSERTLRYDLNAIKDELAPYGIEIRNKSKAGFYIPASQKQRCANLTANLDAWETEGFIQDSDEKRFSTLLLLFLSQKDSLTAEQIADRFYVSRSTVLRMFPRFEKYFDKKVYITSLKFSGYELAGDEMELRLEASKILSALFKGSYTAEDWYILLPAVLKEVLPLSCMIEISDCIKKMNSEYGLWMSNMAFINLLSYLLIRHVRLAHANVLKTISVSDVKDGVSEVGYSYHLIQSLPYAERSENNAELSWLLKVLINNGIYVEQENSTSVPLQEVLDLMIEEIKMNRRNFHYQFELSTLRLDLQDHLEHYIRLETNKADIEENPLIEEIKSKYADFFLLAKDMAKIFQSGTQLDLSESEISYLAIYLYKNKIIDQKENKRVLVVCATGKGLSNLLTTRIRNVFHNLSVVSQVSPYQLENIYQWKEIDFVISTIPLHDCAFPVIKISQILSKEDIQRIQEFLQYGHFIDSIPFNQDHSASFNSKVDPFELRVNYYDHMKEDLASTSTILSKLILTLLEYTSKLPKEYQMSQDALLGLIIHMSMAIPRWFNQTENTTVSEVEEGYLQIQKNHSSVFVLMEKFFDLVEESLLIQIPISERYAFFLYMISEEKTNEKIIN